MLTVASAAEEVIAVVRHSPRRLIEKVGYVTAPGERVSTIVTSGACVESIRARTGWSFEVGAERAGVRS